MADPTIADVMARLDRIEQLIDTTALESRARAAELRLDVIAVRQTVLDLEKSMRDLWTEHWGHEHPTPEAGQ